MRIATSPVCTRALTVQAALQSCKVYVSKGQDGAVIQQLKEAASLADVRVADVFCDEPYDRSNFVLVSDSKRQLIKAAVALSKTAIQCIDMKSYQGSHPSLGAVDHLSCQPVGNGATVLSAAAIATAIGGELGASIPVYMYGAAHPAGQSLAALRRALGYFRNDPGLTSSSASATSSPPGGPTVESFSSLRLQHAQPLDVEPDFGSLPRDRRSGAVAVGASEWVTNFNVPLATDDLITARAVARKVGHRGGGLPFVEAMALRHTNGIEIACNLLNTEESSVEAVDNFVTQLAQQQGLARGLAPYVLGPTRQQLLDEHFALVQSSTTGR